MKISELIEELQKIKALYGDWDICINNENIYLTNKTDLFINCLKNRIEIVSCQ